ncbi:MAG: hypothetical protein JO129_04545 [Candidatus Dependentiae bacterium]|nr:hypothetical protein [Candidatus Dependentiae bacterium]
MRIKNFIFLAVLLIGQLTYCEQNAQEKPVSNVMQQVSDLTSDQQQPAEMTPQSLLALLYSNAGKEYEYYKDLIVNYFKKLYEESSNSENLTPEQLAELEESRAFWKDYNDREKQAEMPTRSTASSASPVKELKSEEMVSNKSSEPMSEGVRTVAPVASTSVPAELTTAAPVISTEPVVLSQEARDYTKSIRGVKSSRARTTTGDRNIQRSQERWDRFNKSTNSAS